MSATLALLLKQLEPTWKIVPRQSHEAAIDALEDDLDCPRESFLTTVIVIVIIITIIIITSIEKTSKQSAKPRSQPPSSQVIVERLSEVAQARRQKLVEAYRELSQSSP